MTTMNECLPSGIEENGSSEKSIVFHVLVVGAGLSGLSTAIGLRLAGHRVTVLEGASQFGEFGVGIQVPPNCVKALKKLGVFENVAEQATWPLSITMKRWKDGQLLGSTPLGSDMEEKYNNPYLLTYRADLHQSLLNRCREVGAEVFANSFVQSVNADHPSVKLVDGSTLNADILVGADGINSKVREGVFTSTERPAQLLPDICSTFRCLVPGQVMREDPILRPLIESPSANCWLGPNGHVMSYPIRLGELYNFALTHESAMDGVKTSKEAPPAEIRTIFDGWDPLIHRLLEKVSTCRQWKTSELEEIPRWISESGKIVLVGDSAHAMLPFLAQGAAMAIEDSVVLVECLSSCKTVEDAPDRLRLYETTRRERVRIIKSGARQNATVWHCADGPFQEARDAIIRYGKDLPTDGTLSHEEAVAANRWNNPAFQEWLFGFDAVLNAKEIILKREL